MQTKMVPQKHQCLPRRSRHFLRVSCSGHFLYNCLVEYLRGRFKFEAFVQNRLFSNKKICSNQIKINAKVSIS